MKVVIYARVSTEEQHKENQIPVLEEWAKNRGWEIVKIYQEDASAWKAGHQKEWANLTKDARFGTFDLVLVWALDRVTRGGIDAIFPLLNALTSYGVKVYSYQESWTEQPNADMYKLLVSIFAWVAEMESKRRSERTKAGMVRAKENDAGDMADLVNKIHKLAIDENCAIILVAHHGKPNKFASDERDAGFDIRGSSAIPGATDWNAGLYKNSDGTTDLKVEGRDIGELEIRIKLDAGVTWTWLLLGDAQDLRRVEAETKIIDAILSLGGKVSAASIAEAADISRSTAQTALKRMREDGKVTCESANIGKQKQFLYDIPSQTSSTSSTSILPQHHQHPLLTGNAVNDVGEEYVDSK